MRVQFRHCFLFTNKSEVRGKTRELCFFGGDICEVDEL